MNAACLMLAMKIVGTVGGLKDQLTERAGDVFESRWIHYHQIAQPNKPEAKSQIHGFWLKPSHI